MNSEYVPFGAEWEREMMKLNKAQLIYLLKEVQAEKLSAPKCHMCDSLRDHGMRYCAHCGRALV